VSRQRKFVSKHAEVPPLRFDGQTFPPASQGWSAETPSGSQSVKRVMSLRLSDGTSKIFRLLTPKKLSKVEQNILRQRAAALLAEILRDNNAARTKNIVRKERTFLKTVRRTLPAKVLKRLRKRMQKKV